MDKVVLFVSIVLLVSAIRCHMLTKANVKTKIDKGWFDRLWSGSRPPKENLTDEGLRFRRQSNIYAIAGFLSLGVYVLLTSST